MIMNHYPLLTTLVIMANIYFLPWIVAGVRGHPNHGAIFVLNLFLGWTLILWVLALIWASTAIKPPQQVIVIRKEQDDVH